MADIFVFGSNLLGRHGAGSALEAYKKHGAILGQGEGRMGQSYAIPTKDKNMKVLGLNKIQVSVWRFMIYAAEYPNHQYNIVDIGCGLAGYNARQIAPMFRNCPSNCEFLGELGTLVRPDEMTKFR